MNRVNVRTSGMSIHSRRLLVFVFVTAASSCDKGPSLPDEADARRAFETRSAELRALETALRTEIGQSGLARERPVCDPPDDPVCLTSQRARDTLVAAGQGRIQRRLDALGAVCAEVTSTSGSGALDLRASVETCEPGRRGDSIAPSDGTTIDGFRVGRGVYSRRDHVFRPGIAVERRFTVGDANASIVVFLFTDGAASALR